MTTLLIEKFINDDIDEWAFSVETDFDDSFENRFVIFVSESYEKIIHDSIWETLWFETLKAKLTALIANETWDVVVLLKNVNIVISKWIFKIKMHVDETLDKLKTKLVTREFSQIWKTDFTNTFASTVTNK